MMKRSSLNQNENAIIVSVPGEERTFPTREALARFVAEADDNRRGVYSNFEYVAKRTLASLNGGGTPPPSDPPVPKLPTPMDDQCAVLDQEEEEVETVYSESKEAWLSRLQGLRAEVPRRFHMSRGNSAELSRFQLWLEDGQAEARNLEHAFQKADRKLQRARARVNALKIARDRWIQEQRVRVSYEGETLTLAEFTERRKREVR